MSDSERRDFWIDPNVIAYLESGKVPNSALILRAIKEEEQQWEADAPEREKFLQWLNQHPRTKLIDGKPNLTTEMILFALEAWKARASL